MTSQEMLRNNISSGKCFSSDKIYRDRINLEVDASTFHAYLNVSGGNVSKLPTHWLITDPTSQRQKSYTKMCAVW